MRSDEVNMGDCLGGSLTMSTTISFEILVINKNFTRRSLFWCFLHSLKLKRVIIWKELEFFVKKKFNKKIYRNK